MGRHREWQDALTRRRILRRLERLEVTSGFEEALQITALLRAAESCGADLHRLDQFQSNVKLQRCVLRALWTFVKLKLLLEEFCRHTVPVPLTNRAWRARHIFIHAREPDGMEGDLTMNFKVAAVQVLAMSWGLSERIPQLWDLYAELRVADEWWSQCATA